MRPREHFDQALGTLHAELNELSRQTAAAVGQAMVALYGRDMAHAQRIIADDQRTGLPIV
jgi:phytoene/squalene synthetase